ncbi:adenine phosphoribosyltransferase [Mycoplasma marinum]|uniref:Adenine phosphoribosyltransferase n=1 Tax=Mycoplasma marinum TaxID=1937190 RepID=A0A4R0XQK1_9MOLU|nr:adenine phosphoribosyltransferase [Mycoplasma marinum]TCG11868.1 adenine phosphoribosyltransferase [Mycoplasma marinum]
MELKKYIREISDFPKKGIGFKDISTLLANGEVFHEVIDKMAKACKEADVIVGADARGFLFGAPVAALLKKPFVMVRKPGKLPYDVIKREYSLEYGTNELQIHTDSIQKGQKVAIVDDLLATGGTTKAIIELVEELGGEVIDLVFLIDLLFVKHEPKVSEYRTTTLIKYE